MVKHQLEYCESFVTKSAGKKTTKNISYFWCTFLYFILK